MDTRQISLRDLFEHLLPRLSRMRQCTDSPFRVSCSTIISKIKDTSRELLNNDSIAIARYESTPEQIADRLKKLLW